MLDAVPAKKTAPGLVQSNVRMPQSALDELDEWAEEMNRAAGWDKHTRSDLIRDIVLKALEDRRTTATARGLVTPPKAKR